MSKREDFIFEEYEGHYILDKYVGDDEEVIIPDEIDGIKIETIGYMCFFNLRNRYNTRIKSVVLPKNLKKIGSEAFAFCVALESVVFPDSLEFIGAEAFLGCRSLKEINLGPNVKEIQSFAFGECCSLKSITIPKSVEILSFESFPDCYDLERISVEEGNKVYDSRNDCNAIIYTEKNIMFLGCKNTIIPDTVEEIDSLTFETTSFPKNIMIPKSVKKIDLFMCRCDKSNIESIVVDERNEVFDSRDNCNAIIETRTNKLILACRNTIIPNTVEIIGKTAYRNCNFIKRLLLPEGVKHIESDYYGAFEDCVFLEEVVLPNSLESIDSNAFNEFYSLERIIIPKGVKKIGESIFSQCNNLGIILVDKENPYYDSRDNCDAIIETKTDTLIAGCKHTKIPESVKAIGREAFLFCDIDEVFIPKGVERIEDHAFSYSRLKIIEIADSVTTIEKSAFASSKLRNIEIPDSVITIKDNAFEGCWSLRNVYIPKSVKNMGSYVFYNCRANLTVYLDKEFIENGVPSGWDDNWDTTDKGEKIKIQEIDSLNEKKKLYFE